MSESETRSQKSNQQVALSSKAQIVDRFTVQLEEKDLLLKKIKTTHNILRTFPGFCRNYIFEQISNDKEYNAIAITEWENQQMLDMAINAITQFPEETVFINTKGNEFELKKHEHNYSQVPFTTDEITKNILIKQISTCHSEFFSLINTLSEEELDMNLINNWSIRDYMLHLAMWQGTVTNLLKNKPRVEAMNIPQDVWDTQDNDKINAVLKEKYSSMSISDVKDLFETKHEEFVKKVNNLTIDELMLPCNNYEKTSNNSDPVISLVSGIGIYHISSHFQSISEVLNS